MHAAPAARTRRLRPLLRRWHLWLGWLVALPLLLWTASGLFMAAVPIERVRGEHLVRPAPPLALPFRPVPPDLTGLPAQAVSLEQRPGGPEWIVRLPAGRALRADPRTGTYLPPLDAAAVRAIVAQRYAGQAPVVALTRLSAEAAPLELRRPVASWQVQFADGARFYLDAGSGDILARRTQLWRVYDVLWGLHILDPFGRENFNTPWLVIAAALSLLSVLLAVLLLPGSSRRGGAAR